MKNIFASFDLGGSFLKYGMGTMESSIQYHARLLVESTDTHYLYSLFNRAFDDLKHHLADDEILAGACIGSPGTANSKTGMIEGINPNLPGWTGANPIKALQPDWQIPIHLENDANLMTFGESSSYPDADSLLGITIGTGIGSGYVNANGIFHGSTFSALEVGHTIVHMDGLLCNCGKKGCVEAYSSANSIVKIISELNPHMDDPSIKDILDQALIDDNIKTQLETLLNLLALSISNAITVLNPEILIVGGGVLDIESFPFSFLEKRIRDFLMVDHKRNLLISKARYGNKAAILGGIILSEKRNHFQMKYNVDIV